MFTHAFHPKLPNNQQSMCILRLKYIYKKCVVLFDGIHNKKGSKELIKINLKLEAVVKIWRKI